MITCIQVNPNRQIDITPLNRLPQQLSVWRMNLLQATHKLTLYLHFFFYSDRRNKLISKPSLCHSANDLFAACDGWRLICPHPNASSVQQQCESVCLWQETQTHICSKYICGVFCSQGRESALSMELLMNLFIPPLAPINTTCRIVFYFNILY